MNTFIVSYDINEGQNVPRSAQEARTALISAIREFGTWAKITESCWAIASDMTATQIRDRLLSQIREVDRLMVVQSAHVAAWHNTFCRNDWLMENI